MALLKEFGKKAGMTAGALLVSAGIASQANAAVVVMDFEQFAPDLVNEISVLIPQTSIVENGLILTETQPGDETFFRAIGELSGGYLGTAALTNFSGVTTLEKDDQSAFDFLSIDLVRIGNEKGFTATFDGLKATGQTVSQTFSIGSTLETLTFNNDFNNVVSVTWQDGNHQMDNITANTVATPLPASALLLASGIGGLIGFRSLSKQKTQPNEYNI